MRREILIPQSGQIAVVSPITHPQFGHFIIVPAYSCCRWFFLGSSGMGGTMGGIGGMGGGGGVGGTTGGTGGGVGAESDLTAAPQEWQNLTPIFSF